MPYHNHNKMRQNLVFAFIPVFGVDSFKAVFKPEDELEVDMYVFCGVFQDSCDIFNDKIQRIVE